MMPIDRFKTCVEYQVRRAEVDVQGFVHEAVYLNWLKEANLQHLQVQGIDLTKFGETAYSLRLEEFNGKYLFPARLAETIKVCCWVTAVEDKRVNVSYEVLRSDITLMRGHARYICVDSTGNAVPFPSDWKAKMEAARNATR